MSKRIRRINELLREEIGKLILREIDLSKDVVVTITKVETSSDLQHVKVKISVMPEGYSEKILRILNKNIFGIQQRLNKLLSMKPVPKIRFEIDVSEEKVRRIDELLRRINE